MLKINGNEIVFSASFMMARGDEVELTPAGIAGLSVKIVANRLDGEIPPGTPDFIRRHAENQMICDVPFMPGGTSLPIFWASNS
jgi:hypothetical protein